MLKRLASQIKTKWQDSNFARKLTLIIVILAIADGVAMLILANVEIAIQIIKLIKESWDNNVNEPIKQNYRYGN